MCSSGQTGLDTRDTSKITKHGDLVGLYIQMETAMRVLGLMARHKVLGSTSMLMARNT